MLSTAQQFLRKFGKIVGSREQTRVAGDSAHPSRRGIVDHAAQHLAVLVVLRGSDARHPVAGGRKRVCVMPSGAKIFFVAYSFNGMPETFSTRKPSVSKLMSL